MGYYPVIFKYGILSLHVLTPWIVSLHINLLLFKFGLLNNNNNGSKEIKRGKSGK